VSVIRGVAVSLGLVMISGVVPAAEQRVSPGPNVLKPFSLEGMDRAGRLDVTSDGVRASPAGAAVSGENRRPVPSSGPVRLERWTSYWRDNRVVVRDGVLENAAGDYRVWFRRWSEGGVRMHGALGGDISYVAVGGADVAPEIGGDGASVFYREVWPGIDVEYRLGDRRVEETLVVKRDPGRANFEFDAVGDELFDLPGGGFSIGAGRLRIDPVTVTDHRGVPLADERAHPSISKRASDDRSRQPSAGEKPSSTRLVVGVAADLFAKAAATEFPIRLDPSTSTTSELWFAQRAGEDGRAGFDGGVNLATGNYTTSVVDADIPVVGPKLRVVRTYNSTYESRLSNTSNWGGFGEGWSGSWNSELWLDSVLSAAILRFQDGHLELFSFDPSTAVWSSPPGSRFRFSGPNPVACNWGCQSERFSVRDRDETSFTFENVRDSSGRFKLSVIRDAAGLSQTYTYATPPEMGIDVRGSLRDYRFLRRITNPDSRRLLEFTYEPVPIPIPGVSATNIAVRYISEKSTDHESIQSSWTYSHQRVDSAWGSTVVLTRAYHPSIVGVLSEDPLTCHCETYSYVTGTTVAPRMVEWRRPSRKLAVRLSYGQVGDPARVGSPFLAVTGRSDETPGSEHVYTYNFASPGPGEGLSVAVSAQFDYYTQSRFTTFWGFDQDRVLRRRTSGDGESRIWSYGAVGDPVEGGRLVEMRFEGDVPSGVRDRETYKHDSLGNVTEFTDRYGHTTFSKFDSIGRLLERRDGRSVSAADDRYKTSFTYWDPSSGPTQRVASETRPAPFGTEVRSYTDGTEPAPGGGTQPRGLLKSVTSPGAGRLNTQATTTYVYNWVGDLDTQIDPTGQVTHFGYEVLGHEMWRSVTADGVTVTRRTGYTNNSYRVGATWGVVVSAHDGEPSHELVTTNTYSDDGYVESQSLVDRQDPSSARHIDYEYDFRGLITKKTNRIRAGGPGTPEVATVEFSKWYDDQGRLVGFRDANESIYNARFDTRGCLYQLQFTKSHQPVGTVPVSVDLGSSTCDSSGRVISRTTPHGSRVFSNFQTGDKPGLTTVPGFSQLPVDLGGTGGATNLVVLNDTYDGVGNLVERVEGNRRTTFEFGASGLLDAQQISDVAANSPVLRRTEYTYDRSGNRLTQRQAGLGRADSPDRTTTWDYAPAGLVKSESVSLGSTALTTTFSYDQRGRKTSSIDPDAKVRTFSYDVADQLISESEPTVAYESTTSSGTAAPTKRYAYDVFGGRTREIDPNGNTTITTFDPMGRKRAVNFPSYQPPGVAAAITPSETFSYDVAGNLRQRVDRRGQVTTFAYNEFGFLTSETAPGPDASTNAVTTYSPDLAGRVVVKTDPNGVRTSFTYDALGRKRSQTVAVRAVEAEPAMTSTTSYDYDVVGNLVYQRNPSASTPNRNVTTATYDAAGGKLSSTDPLGTVTSYVVSPFGETLRTAVDQLSCVEDVFDQAGRRSASRNRGDAFAGGVCARPLAQSLITNYSYDGRNNLTFTTSPEGRVVRNIYDDASRLAAVVHANGTTDAVTTSNFYDQAGNLTRRRDGNGNDITIAYQSWNLPETRTEPQTAAGQALVDRQWTRRYDSGGLPQADIQPGGVQVDRVFDPAGRVRTETASGASGSRNFVYDAGGRMIGFSHPGGIVPVVYNDLNLPVHEGTGSSGTTSLYDPAGRLTVRTDPSGTTSRVYDDASNLTSETDPISGATAKHLYDRSNRRVFTQYFPAGMSQTPENSQRLEYRYFDPFGRLRGFEEYSSVSQRESDWGIGEYEEYFEFDRDGLPTKRIVGGWSDPTDELIHTFEYNRRGQLTKWQSTPDPNWSRGLPGATVTYAYDNAGNRTRAGSTTYSFDAQNRLRSDATTTYTWSDRGCLTASTTAATTTTSDCDAFGQEVRNGGVTTAYDSLGRIAARTANGVTKPFAYSGTGTDPVSDGDWSYSHRADGAVFGIKTPDGAKRWAIENRHGDLAGVVINGYVSDVVAYDPFGKVDGRNSKMTPAINPTVGFQSDWTDPASKQVWMGARHYRPQQATFTTRDTYSGTTADPGTQNRYSYTSGNPLARTDRSGRAWEWIDLDPLNMSRDQYLAGVDQNVGMLKLGKYVDGLSIWRSRGGPDKKYDYFFNAYYLNTPEWKQYEELYRAGAAGLWILSSRDRAVKRGLDATMSGWKWRMSTDDCIRMAHQITARPNEWPCLDTRNVPAGMWGSSLSRHCTIFGVAECAYETFRSHGMPAYKKPIVIQFFCGGPGDGWTRAGYDPGYAMEDEIGQTIAIDLPIAILSAGISSAIIKAISSAIARQGATLATTEVASGIGVTEAAGLSEYQIGGQMEDILAGASRGKVAKSVQYLKEGGFQRASADFEKLTEGVSVVDRGGGLRTATLSNGTRVTVRPFSSGDVPTLEVATPGNPVVKIRY
jgi:RHS repeat-associated protein